MDSASPVRDPNLSAFIWSVADLLRGDYKQSDYGKVILAVAGTVWTDGERNRWWVSSVIRRRNHRQIVSRVETSGEIANYESPVTALVTKSHKEGTKIAALWHR